MLGSKSRTLLSIQGFTPASDVHENPNLKYQLSKKFRWPKQVEIQPEFHNARRPEPIQIN